MSRHRCTAVHTGLGFVWVFPTIASPDIIHALWPGLSYPLPPLPHPPPKQTPEIHQPLVLIMWAALGYHRWDPELISFMSVYHAEEFNGMNTAFVHGASFDFGPDPGSAYLGALA